MANNADLVSYFTEKAAQAEMKGNVAKLVANSISISLIEMWNERWWRFRMLRHNFAITDQSNEYELPANFAGIASIRSEGTDGQTLEILAIEEFDGRYPVIGTGSQAPDACTIYDDEGQQKSYIKFNRVPANQTFPMQIFRTTPSQVESIPDIALGVMRLCVWKNMLVIGSEQFRSAESLYWLRVQELERREGPMGGLVYEMPTGRPSIRPSRRKAPWM